MGLLAKNLDRAEVGVRSSDNPSSMIIGLSADINLEYFFSHMHV
jgi:hypothetical protein